jgi:hypothetical protein
MVVSRMNASGRGARGAQFVFHGHFAHRARLTRVDEAVTWMRRVWAGQRGVSERYSSGSEGIVVENRPVYSHGGSSRICGMIGH